MIAELFYPKELKEIFADLRAKGDLNEDALKEIKKNVWFSFICSAVISLIILVKNSFLISFIFFICFGLFGCFLSLRRAVHMFAVPYTKGKIYRGTIKSARYGKDYNPSAPTGWRIDYSFLNDNGDVIRGQSDVILKEHIGSYVSKNGEEILVYLHPHNPKKHGIFISEYFKKYCLSKSLINEMVDRLSHTPQNTII